MKKSFFLILCIVVGCMMLAGCTTENVEQDEMPLVAWQQNVSEQEIEVEVTELTTTETTNSGGTKVGYGYGYNFSSHKYEYGFGIVRDNETKVVTEYYVTLTDSNGVSYRFKVNEGAYPLFEEGQTIKVKIKSYDPPSLLRSTEFFWNDIILAFDGEVTYISTETETTETEE